jgi:hypothetical protein
MGGLQAVPSCNRTQQVKYDKNISAGLLIYAIVNFSLVLIATVLFLMSVSKFSLVESISAAFMIIWTLGNIGALLDLKKWAFWSEAVRWFVLIAIGIWIFII